MLNCIIEEKAGKGKGVKQKTKVKENRRKNTKRIICIATVDYVFASVSIYLIYLFFAH